MNTIRFDEKFPITNDNGFFNHLIIFSDNKDVVIKHDSASLRKYSEDDMVKISIRIALIPQLFQGINQVLFTDHDYYEFRDDAVEYSVFVTIDDRMQWVRPLSIYQVKDDETIGFQFDWADGTVEYRLEKRVYPAGIYWLIDTLKKIYNDWQKDHPEEPKLD